MLIFKTINLGKENDHRIFIMSKSNHVNMIQIKNQLKTKMGPNYGKFQENIIIKDPCTIGDVFPQAPHPLSKIFIYKRPTKSKEKILHEDEAISK